MNKRRLSSLVQWGILFAGSGSSARAQSLTTQGQPATVVASPLPRQASAAQSDPAKAEQLCRTGKFDEAAQEYQAILQAAPSSPLAYVGLVRVYLKQKKPAEAYAAAAKARELGPTLSAVRVAMGEVYFRQGKMAEAEAEFATLVKASTQEPRAYLGLSRIYRLASYYRQAKIMIDRAHALDPADPDIRKAWMATVGLQERLKALRTYLSGETDDDAEQHRRFEEQLAVLQHEADQGVPTCHLATKLSAMETPLERMLRDTRSLRGFGLRVKVNDVSSKLLLDTGAGGILVNRKIAEKADIKPVVQTDIKGIGDKGPSSGYVGYARSVKIGDLEFQDCYIRVVDKGS